MCRFMPKWLCTSLRIILSEYTIFIATLPVSYMFLRPVRASLLSAGAFIFCTVFALCSRYASRRQESQQQDEGAASNRAIVPEPSNLQHFDVLAPSLINALPTYVFKTEGVDILECTVCLSGIHHGDIVKQLPFCTHLFHKDCIDKWLGLHSTCPVCRIMVNSDLKAEVTLKVGC
ncbi:RING-H2 finger protein ATL4O [Rhynchospora pubera]|uniref:RING-type E3 ubiquitin transferase n=1 Tax=Rhynchospora pubera TaxID=906938 RepID=A0AAV8FDX5_9POAL|nr:RING-H2 finger protein ATL4O [Rhynchospora pubera]